jgi:lipopolysaccharide/colanic/teichoic acid biosynthesis glycosyltransferase
MRVDGATSAAAVDVAPTSSAAVLRQREHARHVRLRDVKRDSGAAQHEDAPLSFQLFMRDLRREKLRADRSSSPLSLVVFELRSIGSADADLGHLLDVLRERTRETDIIGHLDDERIAVLCPDTAAAGAERLARKVEQAIPSAECASVCATYPDAVIEDLVEGRRIVERTQPFVAADRSRGYAAKRLFDVVASLAILVAVSPLLAIVAAAIKLTSRGPAIFKQKRLGQGGVPFTFYKFRSMVDHGDDRIHRAYIANYINEEAKAANDVDGKAPYKLRADPRITLVGKFIRKTSIDELPQLFNVLRGDMSLVGPRPPIPYETIHYHAWHLRRITSMKPGLTGLWQVEGRGRVTFNEMVRLDLRYIRECSLMLDLKILARTVIVVLRCLGAG